MKERKHREGRSGTFARPVITALASALGIGVAGYLACAGFTWRRYGHAKPPASGEETDPILDRFMPAYEVTERHHIRVSAPVEVAFLAATELDLSRSALIRGIFKGRELILRARPGGFSHPQPLLQQMKALGWRVLAEIPEREIVMGAATQPWIANTVFRSLPPGEFASFQAPDYVKIAWTLRADPAGPAESIVRTETRVVTTDSAARAKFRRYWSFFSPGIVLIRKVALRLVKNEAERRARTERSIF
jgi:hypothetical protein